MFSKLSQNNFKSFVLFLIHKQFNSNYHLSHENNTFSVLTSLHHTNITEKMSKVLRTFTSVLMIVNLF